MKQLSLAKPLVALDLETTGLGPAARIVEIGLVKMDVGGVRATQVHRLNPGVPIPPEATAVHGIRDSDVSAMPTLAEVATGIVQFLSGCDLTGFNVVAYDLPLLESELKRVGVDWSWQDVQVVDAKTLFHLMEKRDLSAAVLFYLGHAHDGAHGAGSDAAAALDVLLAQVARYAGLPNVVEGLAGICRPPDYVDAGGKFRWRRGEATMGFGKYKGQTLQAVVANDPSFLQWMLEMDFSVGVKDMVRAALDGRFPVSNSR